MTAPRIEIDLCKIRQNTDVLVDRLMSCGISVTGVTKAVCGDPAIANAMIDGGVSELADARVANVKRMRGAGITCPISMIRSPMLSEIDQIVENCETSYNTEIDVIAELAAAALRKNIVHNVFLMVEMGDMRDGIMPGDLGRIAALVVKMPGVALKGIGANFSCLGNVAPDAEAMADFSKLANDVEGACGPVLKTVSGGGSANLPWALGVGKTGRINNLRLGEAILLGVEPVSGDRIDGMYTDAFTLVAEVIETGAKPAPSAIALVNPTLARRRIAQACGVSKRIIVAMGHQDTDILGLSMPVGSTLIGATSDHLVIGMPQSVPMVGSEVRFQMNYNALMHAMAAPDIEVKLLDDPPTRPSRRTQGKVDHLALV